MLCGPCIGAVEPLQQLAMQAPRAGLGLQQQTLVGLRLELHHLLQHGRHDPIGPQPQRRIGQQRQQQQQHEEQPPNGQGQPVDQRGAQAASSYSQRKAMSR